MTNYEKIKSMSIEEMAGFMREIYVICNDDEFYDWSSSDIKEWLEREVSDDERG